jgi:RNA-directed DNA polymerase
MKARTALLRKLKEVFRRFRSQPVDRVIALIKPGLRGGVNYFRVGHSSRCFGYVKDGVEKKIRRH